MDQIAECKLAGSCVQLYFTVDSRPLYKGHLVKATGFPISSDATHAHAFLTTHISTILFGLGGN